MSPSDVGPEEEYERSRQDKKKGLDRIGRRSSEIKTPVDYSKGSKRVGDSSSKIKARLTHVARLSSVSGKVRRKASEKKIIVFSAACFVISLRKVSCTADVATTFSHQAPAQGVSFRLSQRKTPSVWRAFWAFSEKKTPSVGCEEAGSLGLITILQERYHLWGVQSGVVTTAGSRCTACAS